MSDTRSFTPSMQAQPPDALSGVIDRTLASSPHLWLGGLAQRLARDVWSELGQEGLTPDRYGTHRFLTNDPNAECIILGTIVRSDSDDVPPIAVELLPEITTGRYRGLTFAGRRAAKAARPSLERALGCIGHVPTLSRSVSDLVRRVHVLTAKQCFDVSHSDPEVPFSIFLSLPEREEAHGRVRLAEQIVHECMHLQLTLIERTVPMVADTNCILFSPWQKRPRRAQGVLHGLYVFGVIDAYLEALQPYLEADERGFVERRRNQIRDEMAIVRDVVGALTPAGRRLAERALDRAGRPASVLSLQR